MTLCKKVMNYLEANKDKFVSGRTLKNELSICHLVCEYNELEIRQAIKTLRQQGKSIIANSKGYMLTENQQLIREYVENRFRELKSEYFNLKRLGTFNENQLTIKELE